MKTTCPDEERLFIFVEGGLSLPERTKLREHLSQCAACCQQVATFVAETPIFPQEELPEAFWEHYDQKFDEKLAQAETEDVGWLRAVFKLWSTPVSVPFPLAATALVVIALLSYASFAPGPIQIVNGEKNLQVVDQVLIEDVDAAAIFPSEYY